MSIRPIRRFYEHSLTSAGLSGEAGFSSPTIGTWESTVSSGAALVALCGLSFALNSRVVASWGGGNSTSFSAFVGITAPCMGPNRGASTFTLRLPWRRPSTAFGGSRASCAFSASTSSVTISTSPCRPLSGTALLGTFRITSIGRS